MMYLDTKREATSKIMMEDGLGFREADALALESCAAFRWELEERGILGPDHDAPVLAEPVPADQPSMSAPGRRVCGWRPRPSGGPTHLQLQKSLEIAWEPNRLRLVPMCSGNR